MASLSHFMRFGKKVAARAPLLQSLLDEGALEDVVPGSADARRRGEAAAVEEGAEVGEHAGAAAQHGAVVVRVQRWQAEVDHHLAAGEQVGQAPAVAPSLVEEVL